MNLQEQRNDDNIDVLIFLSNIKKALAEKIHITFLIYLKAIYGQNMK